ncbi:MAG: ABC transporter ATP-binding protein, partial [Candidatus Saccharimonadales bacterium]
MLEVDKISKSFKSGGGGSFNAVDNISFKIDQGAFASIVGPSGSGKTTLLSLLGALDRPSSGSISVDGQDISKFSDHELVNYRVKNVGLIFQAYNLIPNLTALENVMLPMEFAHTTKAERISRAKELLDKVGLNEDKQGRKPGKLSGGEQQRVAIARALSNKPKIILADEPTGNLDSVNGQNIFNLLHELSKSQKTTVIVVTHDISLAGKTDKRFSLQDGKLQTDRGQGRA